MQTATSFTGSVLALFVTCTLCLEIRKLDRTYPYTQYALTLPFSLPFWYSCTSTLTELKNQ